MNEKPDLLPRRLAADVLGDILDEKKPLDGCLEALFARNKGLAQRDKIMSPLLYNTASALLPGIL